MFCLHTGSRDISKQDSAREGVFWEVVAPCPQSGREKVQEDSHTCVRGGPYKGVGGRRRHDQVRIVPSHPWTDYVLMRHSTLGRAYTALISSFSEVAEDHVNFADGLNAQVVHILKSVEKGHDEAKKKVSARLSPPLFSDLMSVSPLSKSKHFKNYSLIGIVPTGTAPR